MRVLSIDWDYFMDVSSFERAIYFPDGGNEDIGLNISTACWATMYLCNNLEGVGVIHDYDRILEKLKSYRPDRIMITDSHKWLATMCKDVDDLTIWNIDFHHDAFGYGPLNCGNWVNVLKRNKDVTVKWIGREDSEEDKEGFTERCSWDELPEDVDWIFLCRSFVWSPPHLDTMFCRLADIIEDICQGIEEVEPVVLQSRWDKVGEYIEQVRQYLKSIVG